MRINKLFLTFSTLFILSLLGIACTNDKANPDGNTDQELYDMAKPTTGFTWYKNDDVLLNKSAGSGHNQPFLRTRYNGIAAALLDNEGKVKAGTIFPDGSLIVKELRDNATSVAIYAVLYKQAGHPDADADGWVWGYVDTGGSPLFPASSKGNSCRGCHSQSENIDFTLMNKYF